MKITPVEANRIFSPTVGIKTNTKDTSTSVTTITISQLYQFVKNYNQVFFKNPSVIGRADHKSEITEFVNKKELIEYIVFEK